MRLCICVCVSAFVETWKYENMGIYFHKICFQHLRNRLPRNKKKKVKTYDSTKVRLRPLISAIAYNVENPTYP